MFALFWPNKDAQDAFTKWMDESAKGPWVWTALDINPEHWGQRRVSIHHKQESFAIEWNRPNKLILQASHKNLYKGRPTNGQGSDFINAVQDTLFEWMSLSPRPKLDERIEKVNEALLEQEDRALMWLKTSFQVIEQALQECMPDASSGPSHAIQAKIFAGQPPHLKDTQAFEWRLILFEIDFQVIFREDARLEVKVYRAQKDPKKKSGGPDLHAVFGPRRREVYDLFVQELQLIGRASSIPK
jgi:hypothetical protein